MSKPRVYIAAPWAHKDQAAEVGAAFKVAGFKVTEQWWKHPTVNNFGQLPGVIPPGDLLAFQEQAEKDYEGVMNAEVFVLLNQFQPQGSESTGKAVETGMALELGIPVVVVGAITNIFHYMPSVTVVKSVEAAIEKAKELTDVDQGPVAESGEWVVGGAALGSGTQFNPAVFDPNELEVVDDDIPF